MARVPEGFGVRRRPDRSVRMQPGEATLDPGMRAQAGQFTDVTSPGYAAQAAAQAERGGAMEFGTSAEAMRDKKRDDLMMAVVAAMIMMGSLPGGLKSAHAQPPVPYGGRGLIGGIDRWEAGRRAGMFGNQPLTQGMSTRVPPGGSTAFRGQPPMPPGRQLPPGSFRGTTMVDPVSSAGLLEFLRRRR